MHIEDLAQILGLYPEQKYASYNYETLANLVYKLAEESELDEFIRRLVSSWLPATAMRTSRTGA